MVKNKLENKTKSKKDKHTNTFFKFSYKKQIIYLGWKLNCAKWKKIITYLYKNDTHLCPYHIRKTHINKKLGSICKEENITDNLQHLHNNTMVKEIYSQQMN